MTIIQQDTCMVLVYWKKESHEAWGTWGTRPSSTKAMPLLPCVRILQLSTMCVQERLGQSVFVESRDRGGYTEGFLWPLQNVIFNGTRRGTRCQTTQAHGTQLRQIVQGFSTHVPWHIIAPWENIRCAMGNDINNKKKNAFVNCSMPTRCSKRKNNDIIFC